jgi:hypothetical protein
MTSMEGIDKATGRGKLRRWAAIALATATALVTTAVLLTSLTQAAPSGWFFRIKRNLSATSDRWSAYPDLGVDADGDPIVAVWIEARGATLNVFKGHVFLKAASASSPAWADTAVVFDASDYACAYNRASVAVTGTVAHVAYVVHKPCDRVDYTELHYNRCYQAGSRWACQPSEVITSTDVDDSYVTSVDVAVDEDGDARLVWAHYEGLGTNKYGKIYYQAQEGGMWQSPEIPYSSGSNGNPAIAWASGYDHIVWEHQDTPLGAVQEILYRRRGTSTWSPNKQLFHHKTSLNDPFNASYPPGNPDVAARENHVYAVWDVDYSNFLLPYREAYVVFYLHSTDWGESFDWTLRQVHPKERPGQDADMTPYDPIDNPLLERAQPSIALNENNLPGVVWHGTTSEAGYRPSVYYSYIVSDTNKWLTPTVLIVDDKNRGVGAASVAMGEEENGIPCLHIVYMKDWSANHWDVYYDSGGAEKPEYPTIHLPLVLRDG